MRKVEEFRGGFWIFLKEIVVIFQNTFEEFEETF